jgi:hypothetical protein
MTIIFDSSLCVPPSEVIVFRDVTLFCSIHDLLLQCERESQDFYWKWLKKYGAWDFLQQIVEENEELGYKIGPKGNFKIDRINCLNYFKVIELVGSSSF